MLISLVENPALGLWVLHWRGFWGKSSLVGGRAEMPEADQGKLQAFVVQTDLFPAVVWLPQVIPRMRWEQQTPLFWLSWKGAIISECLPWS